MMSIHHIVNSSFDFRNSVCTGRVSCKAELIAGSVRAPTLQLCRFWFVWHNQACTIQLLKTARHLLPELIQVMLHKLLHVLVGAAVDVRGDPVKLRLKFGGKVHFHNVRVAYILTQNEDSYL